MRSTRRASTSAMRLVVGQHSTIVLPVDSAIALHLFDRAARDPAHVDLVRDASSSTPASSRLISSRSPSSASNRSSSSTSSSVERDSPLGNCSRDACSTSAAIRTVVSGVRSSCETSEVNRRCSSPNSSSWWICAWMLSAIWL